MKSFLSFIKKYDSIIIHRHVNPDGDALASQFSLKELIKLNFPDKKVYAVGDECPKYLSSIFPKLDVINNSIYKNSLVIVVDTANKDRISDDNWKFGQFILKIDHHVFVEKYANLEIIEENASSCAEVIAKIIFEEKKLKINKEIAKFLMVGIITDTGRFLYKNTKKDSFYYSYKLLEEGVNLESIYKEIYKKDDKMIKFSGYIMLKYKNKGEISYIVLKKGIEKKFKINFNEATSMVNLIFGGKNTKYALYAIWNSNEKLYKISLRSKSKPINKVANKFNGGGHKNAAGAKAKNKREIKKMIGELEKNSES
ncbi:MAG: oligoribonuclease [Candidatus Hepatoplasma vulgare]|nr:MAG: oligoribonuclease [Candidatus Hepatoplasma sp.]